LGILTESKIAVTLCILEYPKNTVLCIM